MISRARMVAAMVSLLALGTPAGVKGQGHVQAGILSCTLTEEQCEFLRDARRATEGYSVTAAAIADGFRPMGADAPAMGRHWLNLGRLFDGKIDSATPDMLTYALVGGRETLVGIGFGYVVGPASHGVPPPGPFAADSWHVHAGTLDVESRRLDHGADAEEGSGSVEHGREPEQGLALLHAWVWVENPAGIVEPNNWSLPYLRLGLSRPADATPEADRAIFLASSGADFFIERTDLFMVSDPGSAGEQTQAWRAAETEVREWWQDRLPGPLMPAEVEWLGSLFQRFGLTVP